MQLIENSNHCEGIEQLSAKKEKIGYVTHLYKKGNQVQKDFGILWENNMTDWVKGDKNIRLEGLGTPVYLRSLCLFVHSRIA